MPNDWSEFSQYVQTLLQKGSVPGAQVCVRDASGIVYSESFGYRDEAKTKPINAETIFGIASMSKSVTSCAAALLEAEGKLCFDDPVEKYLPGFCIPGMPPEAVLVDHLATHTTGIPPIPTLAWSMVAHTKPDAWEEEEYQKLLLQAKSKVDTIQDIIDYIAAGDYTPLGQAGEYRSYSNDGYALLSSVIDAASGEPLESYLKMRLFQPLGMQHTTFSLDEILATKNVTSLFVKTKEGVKASDIWDSAPPYRGCGWIKSTASDMTRYYLMLSQSGFYEGKQILPKGCTERLFGNRFAETAEGKYCCGLNKRTFSNRVICDHSGGLKGVASRGGFLKDEGYAVTVLTNLSNFNTAPIINGAFNLKMALPMQQSHQWAIPSGAVPQTPEMYLGRYCIKEGSPVEILVSQAEDGQLQVTVEGVLMPLLYCGKTNFLLLPPDTKPEDGTPITAFIREGKAWALLRGSRMIQRI